MIAVGKKCFPLAMLVITCSLTGCTNSGTVNSTRALAVVEGANNTYKTLDALDHALALDAQLNMGWVDNGNQPWQDYDVEVYKGGPSIGTLLVEDMVHFVNSTACKPNPSPQADSINVFASYEIDGSTAVTLGLPIPQIPLGATYGRDTTLSYTLDDAQMAILPDDELNALLASPKCATRIAQIPKNKRAWIVRGLISAKRTYNFYVKTSGGVSLILPGFTATNGVTDAVTVKGFGNDSANRTYFMILKPLPDNVPVPATPIEPSTIATKPCSTSAGNKIYIQRDKTDETDAAKNILTSLKNSNFKPDPTIQGIESNKMPSTAQVRYFWSTDKDAAVCAASILQEKGYQDAKAYFLPLASPQGQLEVWLTKAKS